MLLFPQSKKETSRYCVYVVVNTHHATCNEIQRLPGEKAGLTEGPRHARQTEMEGEWDEEEFERLYEEEMAMMREQEGTALYFGLDYVR